MSSIKAFGKNLKSLRKKSGFTQPELAKESKVATSIVNDIENYWGIKYKEYSENILILDELKMVNSNVDCIVIPTFWPQFEKFLSKLYSKKNRENISIFRM